MSAVIYLEGGAGGPKSDGSSSKYLTTRCQQAFHKLLDAMGFKGRKPRLVPCGGRGRVYDRFCTAHRAGGGYIAMWIDSEEPMEDVKMAWDHLAKVTTVQAWERPDDVFDDQVLFMTTCMETWIVADRATLKKHFGPKLIENRLPTLVDLEGRNRHEVQDALMRATEYCASPYKKEVKSFMVLAEINPDALQDLPSFERVKQILNKKLPRR